MNTTITFLDLTREDQLNINAGSDAGSRTFWKDFSWLVGKTIHTIALYAEAFGGGAAIVPGYIK